MKYEIGMIGLGVMGRNLALNMERNGFGVIGFDIDPVKRQAAVEQFVGKQISVAQSLSEFFAALRSPKIVWLMVPAGKPVDAVIDAIKSFLKPGDLIIDGGNSHFTDSERRWKSLKKEGLLFIGTGVSGGEEGALYGPSLMPGGEPAAWPLVENIFKTIAAKTDEGAVCAEWIGEGGSGHFVKMIHNGIEYADMQMIGEAYFLMDRILHFKPEKMSAVFARWNKGKLNSYLIDITARILAEKDTKTGKAMVDVILDRAGQKGTGKWAAQTALDLGVPAQTFAEAVFARFMSALKQERLMASEILAGPKPDFTGDPQAFIDEIAQALYAAKICSYAQGFQLMRSAGKAYGWKLNFASVASLWRAGCIIRAQFLDAIRHAFERNPELNNLLLDDYFKEILVQTHPIWRRVIIRAVEFGVPVPALSSALAYYDSYRSARLPANLLQAQRDYFGAHTFERIDAPEGRFFHHQWNG